MGDQLQQVVSCPDQRGGRRAPIHTSRYRTHQERLSPSVKSRGHPSQKRWLLRLIHNKSTVLGAGWSGLLGCYLLERDVLCNFRSHPIL
jgi:hypothetical protein